MNSSSQPGVQFWRRIMSDSTGTNSRSLGLLCDISRSVFSSGVLLARCRKRGHFSQVPSCISPLICFFFLPLHQGASRYQQPGPRRPQVHHEVERPLAAGASRRSGAGGLSEQRHLLPTERRQAAKRCLHLR